MAANKTKVSLANVFAKVVKGNYFSSQSRQRHKKFLFLEWTFHTLALHRGLSVVAADELRGIVFRKQWELSEMTLEGLYHPVKDFDLHQHYRELLAERAHVKALTET